MWTTRTSTTTVTTRSTEPVSKSRRFHRDVDGILLLDKPLGLSSNAALQRARALFGAVKAGHAGSLDPLASGLLPVCFGQATKVCGRLLNSGKTYRVLVKLGERTESGDCETEVCERAPVPPTSARAPSRGAPRRSGRGTCSAPRTPSRGRSPRRAPPRTARPSRAWRAARGRSQRSRSSRRGVPPRARCGRPRCEAADSSSRWHRAYGRPRRSCRGDAGSPPRSHGPRPCARAAPRRPTRAPRGAADAPAAARTPRARGRAR